MHALATRDAVVGETLISTSFKGCGTRGFASAADMTCAVCIKPGTELAFADDVRYHSLWGWTRKIKQRVAKFGKRDEKIVEKHHDAIEFPDGRYVMVDTLCAGQRVTVLQMPVSSPPRLTRAERALPQET